MMRVTAISVAYKARAIIGDALRSLQPAHEAGLLDCIIVDNDSGDGTPAYVREAHPWATVIESGGNIGFGRGCNLGLAAAETEFVLFLNPDAELDLAGLRTLVAFLDAHPEAGLIGPAIRDPDGGLQVTDRLPSPGRVLRGAAGRGGAWPIEPGQPPFRTEWLCGAALLGRTALLRELGGFDPRFFLYFEETDLCRRILASGSQIWAVPEAVARHRDGEIARATRRDMYHGCIAQHYFESRFYYLVKHYGWPAAVLTETADAVTMGARALVRLLRGRPVDDFRVRMRSPFYRLPAPIEKA